MPDVVNFVYNIRLGSCNDYLKPFLA